MDRMALLVRFTLCLGIYIFSEKISALKIISSLVILCTNGHKKYWQIDGILLAVSRRQWNKWPYFQLDFLLLVCMELS